MLLPYTVNVPMERLPVANWTLVGLIFLVTLGAWIARSEIESTPGETPQEAAEKYEASLPMALKRGSDFAPPQLLTFNLVHQDTFRLLSSLLFLFVFGYAVNPRLGSGPFLLAFFICGIVGGISWLITGSGTVFAGAAGAVMGIAGLFLVFFPTDKVLVAFWTPANSGTFEVHTPWMLGIFLAVDLVGCLWGGGGPFTFVAHLVAGLAGLCLGIALLRWRWATPSDQEENLLQLLGLEPRTRKMMPEPVPEEERVELEDVRIRSGRSARKRRSE